MASGCIMEMSCWVCGEIVWEDEWDMHGDRIIHSECKLEAMAKTSRLEGIHQLKETNKLDEIEISLKSLKEIVEHLDSGIQRIEDLIR